MTHRTRRSRLVIAVVLALVPGSACRSKAPDVNGDTALARDLAEVQLRGMQTTPKTLADSQAVSVGMRPLSDSAADVNTEVVATSPTASPPARVLTGATPTPTASHTAARSARAAGSATVELPRAAASAGRDTSASGPCRSPSLASQRACIDANLAVSDVRLNSVYGALIRQLRHNAGPGAGREPRMVRGLRSAQRAWIVTRDQDCLRRTKGVGGPLWAPARSRCLAEESEKRADELDAMLRAATAH
ncbi:MAG: lysozyme inhibitor LprI family protein [Gemmatimonadaceae bacterium]